jgi:hypothetical protein
MRAKSRLVSGGSAALQPAGLTIESTKDDWQHRSLSYGLSS